MVKLKFIIREGVLVLRFSELKVRYYQRVGHLLKGCPNLKHFDKDKQRFSSYALFYCENNKILEDYKKIYAKIILEHPELTAKQVSHYYKIEDKTATAISQVNQYQISDYSNSVEKYLEVVIMREEVKQGCNFEIYQKLLTRCRKTIPGFSSLTFSMIDFNRMVGIAYIFARDKAYKHTTKAFRALLGRASKDRDVNFSLAQIGDFCFNDYNPNRYATEIKHPDVLTEEQVRKFMNMDIRGITPTYLDRRMVQLYYDFCVFMLHSFFAPCDVIKAKLSDITRNGTIITQRKKTHRYAEVPITPVMQLIIDKYRGMSKDGYIFPIMDDKKESEHKTKDYIYKRFRGRLDLWLKRIGEILGTDFNMYSYVFRHTAITIAVNSNLPVSYVANVAGTSVEVIQKHYYNGETDRKSVV